ncbi:MAG: hypothetical protein ABSE45_10430 [Candidatus Acidiferrales bacterium]
MHKFWIWWATLSDGEKLALFVLAIVLVVWLARRILWGVKKSKAG